MNSYILHLARSTDRKGLVEDLVNLLPNAQVLPSVDGAELTAKQCAAAYHVRRYKPDYPFKLKLAEIGCFLSHRSAWQSLVDSDSPAAWIAEDDLAISPKSFQTLSELVAPYVTEDSFIRVPLQDRELAHDVIAQQDAMSLIRPKAVALSAAFYLIGRAAAQRLLELTAPFDRPVDTFLQMRWLTQIDILVVKESTARTAAFEVGTSTIQSKKSLPYKIKRIIPRVLYRLRVKKLAAQQMAKRMAMLEAALPNAGE